MEERGNRLLRRLDRHLGIPLTVPAAIFRRLDRPRGVLGASVDGAAAPRRICILCPGAIGDAVLLSALVLGIRQQEPTAAIDFLGSTANGGVLPLLPSLGGYRAFPIAHVGAIIAHLRHHHYDVLIDASQWARWGAVVSAVSGAALTVGFRTQGQWRSLPYDVTVLHRGDRHELENFLELGRAVWPEMDSVPALELGKEERQRPWKHTIFCHFWPAPGAGSALKLWPLPFWAAFIRLALAQGYQMALTGSGEDAPATERFLADYFPRSRGVYSLAGAVSLPELARRMRQCAAVVAVNTGIVHLAAALGVPVVGLHGPTNPRRWGPVGERTVSLLPRLGACAYLNLGFEYPPGAQNTMEHLPVGDVVAALRTLGVPWSR